MSNRIDLYKDIHKGLRSFLIQQLATAGPLDLANEQQLQSFNLQLQKLMALLDEHGMHEDKWLHPLLTELDPTLAEKAETQHQRLDNDIAIVCEKYSQLAALPVVQRAQPGHQAYLLLAEFVGAYLSHMHLEESEVLVLLQSAYSDAELLEIQQQLRSSVTPQRMADYLSIIIPALNIDERSEMLGEMQRFAPVEVFQGVCQLSATLLSANDWTTLQSRLGLS